MIDANARVGTCPDETTGTYAAEQENEQGTRLRQAVAAANLFLPNTFHDCALGQSVVSWTASNGATHRIDYVALSKAWRDQEVRVLDPGPFDLTISREDHRP
eukprot:10502125-Alexandrium_andersonii.AAC.1